MSEIMTLASALAPISILLLGILVLAVVHALGRSGRALVPVFASLTILATGVRLLAGAPPAGQIALGGSVVLDPLAELFDVVLALCMAGALALRSTPGTTSVRPASGENSCESQVWPGHAALIMAATVGAMISVHALDLMTLVLGLEIAGLAVVPLLGRGGADDPDERPDVRWLVAHGVSAGILLMGLALLYGATSTLDLMRLGAKLGALFTGWAAGTVQKAVEILQLPQLPIGEQGVAHLRDAAVKGTAPAALLIPGFLLTLAGLVTRLGVVFLHRGRPTVFTRAPVASVAVCEGVIRLAGVVALARTLPGSLNTARLVYAPYGWTVPLGTIALFTLILGALGAARWRESIVSTATSTSTSASTSTSTSSSSSIDLRDFLAWSGLYNAGWILLGLIAAGDFYAHAGLRSGGFKVSQSYAWGMDSGDQAMAGVLLFSVSAALASLGVLAAVSCLERRGLGLRGLARRRPWVALGLVVCLLSWIGAPLTGGFAGRAALALAGVVDNNAMVRALVVVAALGGVVVALRGVALLLLMLAPEEEEEEEEEKEDSSRAAGASRAVGPAITLLVASALSLALGVGGARAWQPFARASVGTSLKLGSKARATRVERALAPDGSDGALER